MPTPPGALDLAADVVELTRALCDLPSESGRESRIADAVEGALSEHAHLEVLRLGNTVVARTALGRPRRVAIAGHLDTVPINGNVPTRFETLTAEQAAADVPGTKPGEYLWGRGTVDMKAGVAVHLKLAAELSAPAVDVTWIFYDNEEVSSELNGLGRLAELRPDLMKADFAILGEPTAALVEGGCNGSLRADIRTRGRRAHSARAWTGENAIHTAAPILERLAAYEPATVAVDGLEYREGLNATRISGGVAGNVIPDECVVHVNYRFAPDKTLEQAEAHLREVLDGFELEVVDRAPGARPGLDAPVAQGFLAAVGGEPRPKYGWTDVARFFALGVPAVNYGPGDAQKAHADDERVLLDEIRACERGLRAWLSDASAQLAPEQSHTEQAHTEQAHTEQTHTEQAHTEQAHAEQAHTEQAHAEQAHAEQAHAEQAHAEQAHAEQAHAEQAHAEQAHAEQAHTEQAHTEQAAAGRESAG